MSYLSSRDIVIAHRRIHAFVHRTPLAYNHELSRLIGGEVFLKLEPEQKTGSNIDLHRGLTL